jgi:hypothetical protein
LFFARVHLGPGGGRFPLHYEVVFLCLKEAMKCADHARPPGKAPVLTSLERRRCVCSGGSMVCRAEANTSFHFFQRTGSEPLCSVSGQAVPLPGAGARTTTLSHVILKIFYRPVNSNLVQYRPISARSFLEVSRPRVLDRRTVRNRGMSAHREVPARLDSFMQPTRGRVKLHAFLSERGDMQPFRLQRTPTQRYPASVAPESQGTLSGLWHVCHGHAQGRAARSLSAAGGFRPRS